MSFIKNVAAITISIMLGHNCYAEPLHAIIRQAVLENPNYLSTKAAKLVKKSELRQAFSGYLPTIDAFLSFGKERTTNKDTREDNPNGSSLSLTSLETSLVLSQMLFDGFAVKNKIEAKAAEVKAAEHNEYNSIEDVIFDTALAYVTLLNVQMNEQYAKQSLVRYNDILKITSKNNVADSAQIKAKIAWAKSNLLDWQLKVQQAENFYRQVIGKRDVQLARPKPPEKYMPESEDGVVAMALQYNPQIMSASADIYAARANKREAMAAYYPELSVELIAQDGRNRDGIGQKFDKLSAMLKLSYNIFKGGNDRAKENKASWQLVQAKENLRILRRSIASQARTAWDLHEKSREKLKFLHARQVEAKKSRDGYFKLYKSTSNHLLNLLNLEQELLNANIEYINVQLLELMSRYKLLALTGNIGKHFRFEIGNGF